jgi:nitroimidazol reductase NimA-like FMN-containing flavoprotein (pyridoxamine 5'-phosphate oxidase superfamily)
VSDEESKKEAALERSSAVNLVAYEWNTVDDWRSVIISGEFTPILDNSPDSIDAGAIFAEHASVASLSVFDKPLSELTPVWHELTIEEMTGRQAPDINKI